MATDNTGRSCARAALRLLLGVCFAFFLSNQAAAQWHANIENALGKLDSIAANQNAPKNVRDLAAKTADTLRQGVKEKNVKVQPPKTPGAPGAHGATTRYPISGARSARTRNPTGGRDRVGHVHG